MATSRGPHAYAYVFLISVKLDTPATAAEEAQAAAFNKSLVVR